MNVAYDRIGRGYSNFRSSDPDIAAAIILDPPTDDLAVQRFEWSAS